MKVSKNVKEVIRSFGIDIRKYPGELLQRRQKLLQYQNIELILDVGANIGQFGSLLRRIGYDRKIISFEPLSTAYKQLSLISNNDPKWEIKNIALGDEDGEAEINVAAGTAASSSILEMLPTHTEIKPQSNFIDKEVIQIRKLDTVFEDLIQDCKEIYLKIDTQGYEKNVLVGATESLRLIKGIQIEMSLVELYKGEMLYAEVIAWLNDIGYHLHSIEPGFYDKESGRLLQMDGIFFKE